MKLKNKSSMIIIILILLVCICILIPTMNLIEKNRIANNSKNSNEKLDEEKSKEKIMIDCWGDSLTAGAGGNGTTYPKVLSSLLGENYIVTNYGVGGENTITIAGRQGGIPYVIADSFTIPPDKTPVNITIKALNGNIVAPLRQGNAGLNTVVIGEIEGTISIKQDNYVDSNYSYSFTRKEIGEETKINSGTEIISYASRNNYNHILVIWMGQNGGYNNPNDLIEQYKTMINKNGNDKYIIIGIPTGTKNSRSLLESLMEDTFGEHYLNIREYMTQPIYENDKLISCKGLQDCSLPMTEEDLTLIKQGTIPDSLRVDKVHGNSEYYSIVGKQVHIKGIELGYW